MVVRHSLKCLHTRLDLEVSLILIGPANSLAQFVGNRVHSRLQRRGIDLLIPRGLIQFLLLVRGQGRVVRERDPLDRSWHHFGSSLRVTVLRVQSVGQHNTAQQRQEAFQHSAPPHRIPDYM
jgi:hypothetical protein